VNFKKVNMMYEGMGLVGGARKLYPLCPPDTICRRYKVGPSRRGIKTGGNEWTRFLHREKQERIRAGRGPMARIELRQKYYAEKGRGGPVVAV
jgi:hypothetical protein